MSTIEPNTESIVISPTLRRRISEIMEEKGKAFSKQAIATRIGMNYATIRKKLSGESKISLFELRRIAEALHTTVERLMQNDTKDDLKKLSDFFSFFESTNKSPKEAPDFRDILEIAKRLATVAMGITERSKTLNDLGRVYFYIHKYQEAQESWEKALEFSERLVEKYNETDHYHLVLSNLLISFTMYNANPDAKQILKKIENVFIGNFDRVGVVFYVRAKIAEFENDLHQAVDYAYRSLDCFLNTGNNLSIGKAEATVAHYQFKLGEYQKAKVVLESSIEKLEPYVLNWLISMKDYIKILLKLGDLTSAEVAVLAALKRGEPFKDKYPDIVGKLLILLSHCRKERSLAESVLYDKHIGEKVRTLAYNYLKRYCIDRGDRESLMKYVIIENELGISKIDLLDEEAL